MRKIKNYLKRRLFTPLQKDEVIVFRNILKLLYHRYADIPMVSTVKGRYIIQVPSINVSAIIDSSFCEIVNSNKNSYIKLPDEVYSRLILLINKKISDYKNGVENNINKRKNIIISNIFNEIK